MKTLKIALPKGSLQESSFRLLKKAGFNVSVGSRSYVPHIDDPELEGLLIRAQEIPRYVEEGVLDCGLTGQDWVLEQGAQVKEVTPLLYSKGGLGKVRWVVAVPIDSPVQKLEDLKGKRIATELEKFTRRYFENKKIPVEVEFSWGATEVKAPRLVDAIVELTETGSSLRANGLRIIETILESTTVLIANPKAWEDPWKRNKLENLATLFLGALAAEEKVGIKMNIPQESLKKVSDILPALHTPTLSPLADKGWLSLEVIVDEKVVREVIPALKKAGATGIVEYPLNKVIP